MHVLLPAVRRLQSDYRFHGARLTKFDVDPGLLVGLLSRILCVSGVTGAKIKKKK